MCGMDTQDFQGVSGVSLPLGTDSHTDPDKGLWELVRFCGNQEAQKETVLENQGSALWGFRVTSGWRAASGGPAQTGAQVPVADASAAKHGGAWLTTQRQRRAASSMQEFQVSWTVYPRCVNKHKEHFVTGRFRYAVTIFLTLSFVLAKEPRTFCL